MSLRLLRRLLLSQLPAARSDLVLLSGTAAVLNAAAAHISDTKIRPDVLLSDANCLIKYRAFENSLKIESKFLLIRDC